MSMQYSLSTCTLVGVEAIPVTVEVDIGPGLPGIYIVGLADLAVQEARQRVRSALRSCGYTIPDAKIVINLAPGPLKKTGSGFDLPIAVALLCATKQVADDWVKDSLIVGELSLEGKVRPVNGLLACALAASAHEKALVCASVPELARKMNETCRAIGDIAALRNKNPWTHYRTLPFVRKEISSDYADIAGDDVAKRALQIAAAGSHGILLQGPPGSGKTMLAKRLPSILPPLTCEEMNQTALIHSVAGLGLEDIFAGSRPFRAPHHSASTAGLIGGGSPVKPGEASLAHNGVLFLDEMSEFSPNTLQALRQPLEAGEITLVRADARVRFPARFMLVGAANPCPCGYLGDNEKPCTCSLPQIARYASRIGGPLMDRIDLVVDVWRSDPENVMQTGAGVSSASLLSGVLCARERATARKKHEGAGGKRQSAGAVLIHECDMVQEDSVNFEELARQNHLSGRGIMRTLRVARTIADLEGQGRVGIDHILEALIFRVRGGADG